MRYSIPYPLDDPRTTLAHRQIILENTFLKQLYQEWYQVFIETARSIGRGVYLEIGSGGGFLRQLLPEIVTSDVRLIPGVDKVIDAESLPYKSGEVGCILMLNTFHHIPRPYRFLEEADRVLMSGGHVVMIEPANSAFGRFIYRRIHNEPFDPAGSREIPPGNPLSGSNQALAHIYFERDRAQFERDFPRLKLTSVSYHTPFRYLISGGLTMTPLMPTATFSFWTSVERLLSPFDRALGLFCTIKLAKA